MLHLLECHACSDRMRHRHPAEKATFSAGLLLLTLLLPPPGPALVLLAVAGAAKGWAEIPWRVFGRTLLIPSGFILLGTLPLLVSVSFDQEGMTAAWVPEQAGAALHLLLRALAAAACLCFLALTTPVMDWLPLLRRLRLPAVVVDVMLVLYRMIFVLAERFSSIRLAQESRLGYSSIRNTFRSSGMTGANLLVFSLKRAHAMELGMAARGYDGDIRTLPPEHHTPLHVLGCTALAGLVISLVTFGIRSLLA